MAHVVELVLIIQSSVGKKASVVGTGALGIGSQQGVWQKFLSTRHGIVGVAAPTRPATEPEIQTIGGIYFIIKAEETAYIMVLAGVIR